MNDERLMSKQRLTKALSRFDSITRDHGLGDKAGYMLTIPRAVTTAVLVIFRDQVPEDEDTRTIRDAMGKVSYRFQEDLEEEGYT